MFSSVARPLQQSGRRNVSRLGHLREGIRPKSKCSGGRQAVRWPSIPVSHSGLTRLSRSSKAPINGQKAQFIQWNGDRTGKAARPVKLKPHELVEIQTDPLAFRKGQGIGFELE